MDNIPGWKVFSAGIGIAALAVVGYFAYTWFIAGPDDLKELQEQAVDNALDQLAEKYEEKVRLYGEQVVVVMPVRGQETSGGQIRYMIIDRLNEVEGVKADVPRDPTLDERATKVLKGIFEGDGEDAPDPTKVFEQSGEADEVLAVTVDKISSTADNGVCMIDIVRIVRDESTPKREGKVLDAERITGRSGAAAIEGDEEEVDSGPGFWSNIGAFLLGALIVLASTAILPFLSWPLAKVAFKQDSNAMNAALLFGLTVLELGVLFSLSWFGYSTTSLVVCGALLLPVALVWNLKVLNFIEEQ